MSKFLRYNSGKNYLNIDNVTMIFIEERKSEKELTFIDDDFNEEKTIAEGTCNFMKIMTTLQGSYIVVDEELHKDDYYHNLNIINSEV